MPSVSKRRMPLAIVATQRRSTSRSAAVNEAVTRSTSGMSSTSSISPAGASAGSSARSSAVNAAPGAGRGERVVVEGGDEARVQAILDGLLDAQLVLDRVDDPAQQVRVADGVDERVGQPRDGQREGARDAFEQARLHPALGLARPRPADARVRARPPRLHCPLSS